MAGGKDDLDLPRRSSNVPPPPPGLYILSLYVTPKSKSFVFGMDLKLLSIPLLVDLEIRGSDILAPHRIKWGMLMSL